MQETVLNSEEIYRGRVIQLSVLDVRLPNGKTSRRELIKHPGAVAIIALDAANNVLLVRQFRMAADRVMMEIPAGTLEPGEDPLVCAERELQEETGYRPGKLEAFGGIYVAPGYTSEFIHHFIATDLTESRLEMDDDEFIEASFVPMTEALAMIERGEIIDGKSISGLLKVARRLGL
ncbi:MAG: NUDIX hydrolase [Anaerolineae bacterium]|uniref:NUDIX hydrolase n=1 Tax=Candidatus Flexifilum breve TaxID=3140694 RepID=UPI001AC0B6F9|nr:NUDIX hydrolase [Chloroflexota bacterium]MBN8635777.1 NUDIX hydrolase [Anaerolineae bacterium]